MEALKKERNSSIELLRLISMFFIVIGHFASHGEFNFLNTEVTVPRLWFGFIALGGSFGVDIFVFISGYFLIMNKDKLFNLKKCLVLWGQIEFYSVAIYLISILTKKQAFGLRSLIKALFPISSNLWWFASAYFILFLMHPFINKALHSLDKKQYQLLLVIMTILWSVIPSFSFSMFGANEIIEIVFLYTVAGYLRLYGLNEKLKGKHYFGLWLFFAAVTYLSFVVFVLLGQKVKGFSDSALFYVYGRTKLPLLCSAVCFFMWFAKMPSFKSKIINVLSSATFGVYLIHDSRFFRNLLWLDIFKNANYQNSIYLIPYSIGVCLLVFSVCLIIDLIRKYTLEKLYLIIIEKTVDTIKRPFVGIIDFFKNLVFGR